MERARFSRSGEYVAVTGTDGRLRIWETESNTLKHEFTPSSHLSATCTTLEWAPVTKEKQTKKRKTQSNHETIVMGTAVGSLLFYDVTRAELLAQSKDAHAGKVRGITWSPTTFSMYSCGDDGYVNEFDPGSTSASRRWRGSKLGLSSIHIFHENLLTAGQGITLWDLKTKTAISSFTGHASQVVQLESVPTTNYFITMGQGERFLKIWSSLEKNSVASLSIAEIPNFFSLAVQDNSAVSVSVVTQKGQLHLFQHKLNGSTKKPVAAQNTLRIAESADPTKSIPILASYLPTGTDNPVVIGAYGSWTSLRFEPFEISSLQNQCTTISRSVFVTGKNSRAKTSQPNLVEVPADVKHLHPGTDDGVVGEKAKKRKKGAGIEPSEDADGELPMEERLTNLTITSTSTGIRENNLSHLLSQGLHSKDTRILHSVLSRYDDEVITNTIRSLPIQLIVSLLKQAKEMLAGKGQINNSILKWIKTTLQVHSSYLMCCPSTEELLSPFMSLLQTREVLYPQMCQLKGKLLLIKGHIESQQYRSEPANEELLNFNDEPNEDEDDEDMIPSDSEPEEALSSDDLTIDNSSDEGSDGEVDDLDDDAASSQDELDMNVGEEPSKNRKKKSQKYSNAPVENSRKIKGKIVDEDDGPESMDEDG